MGKVINFPEKEELKNFKLMQVIVNSKETRNKKARKGVQMSEKMKKIAINCHANLNFGEGEVKIKSFFEGLSPLMKADLLKDWKGEIDYLYEKALKEWRHEMKKLQKKVITDPHLKEFVKDAEEMVKDAVDDQANIKKLREENDKT